MFSQVSDSKGALVQSKFDAFLREALKLPTAVNEGPSFGYTHTVTRSCFSQQARLRFPFAVSCALLPVCVAEEPCLFVSVEEGDAQHVPGHHSRASSVPPLAAPHAPHGQRGARYPRVVSLIVAVILRGQFGRSGRMQWRPQQGTET